MAHRSHRTFHIENSITRSGYLKNFRPKYSKKTSKKAQKYLKIWPRSLFLTWN